MSTIARLGYPSGPMAIVKKQPGYLWAPASTSGHRNRPAQNKE